MSGVGNLSFRPDIGVGGRDSRESSIRQGPNNQRFRFPPLGKIIMTKLVARLVKNGAPKPNTMMELTSENISQLSHTEIAQLLNDAWNNNTLYDALSRIKESPNGQEILQNLDKALERMSSDGRSRTNADAKQFRMLLLAYATANSIELETDKNSTTLNFNALRSDLQTKILSKLASADGANDESTPNGKIFKFFKDNLTAPKWPACCTQWNVEKLSSEEAFSVLTRSGSSIADNLAVITDQTVKDQLLKQLLPKELTVLVNNLLNCYPGGLNLLRDLINGNKLPNLSPVDSSAAKDFACCRISCGPSGLDVVKAFINAGKLDPKLFSPDEAREFANALLWCGAEGFNYLADLINGNKLPSLPPMEDSSASKDLACFLISRGPSGLDVVKAFINAGKLKPEQFKAQDAKEFVDALLAYGSSGADYVIELIDDSGSKLPKLASPGEVKTRASQFKKLHSTFEHRITKAFLGETSNVDGESWEIIREQLGSLTLARARGIWQTIANEVAAGCFGANGKIDIEKLKGLMAFLGNEEIFKKPPYCFIPNVELMRSQMYMVCESLLSKKSKALDLLNAANGITVGTQGQAILATMSNGRTPSLTPAVAILSSLFTPHRQRSLPTCAMNSLINAEIRNHPERLIEMYEQMLGGNQFTLPGGHAIQQQKIEGGFITVDLKNGWWSRSEVFGGITSRGAVKVKKRKERWQEEGIICPESGNPEDKYKLNLPVYNMNDILFAHFFQASDFGNRNIDIGGNYGTMLLYAGHKRYSKTCSPTISVRGSNFSKGMEKLRKYAEDQRELGHHYMRAKTTTGKFSIFNHSCHTENIDINALLALDLDSMEIGKAYPIGDRNWSSWNMSYDIPRLAIRKMDNKPTYEFGTLWNGSQFEKINMDDFEVYTTDIQEPPIKP
jgi:hypothetical protein